MTKVALDDCLELCGDGFLEEEDNAPGVYRPTAEGEKALEKWDGLPNQAV